MVSEAQIEAAAIAMCEEDDLLATFFEPDEIQALARAALEAALAVQWQPIETCPYKTQVDLWCVYGGEEFARYDGGAPIGIIVPDRFRSHEYEWFGNRNSNHIPRADADDIIPVAWRPAVPFCPPELIAKVLSIPLTREDAIAADQQADRP